MTSPNLSRPALGEVAPLGALYDARTDTFLPRSLFKHNLPNAAITSSTFQKVETEISNVGGIKEKLEKFGFGSDLKASFLAGLVRHTGSARFLDDETDAEASLHCSLYYTAVLGDEKLELFSADARDEIDGEYLSTDCRATHVVTAISWGYRAILSANLHLATPAAIQEIEPNLVTVFSSIAEQGAEQEHIINLDPDLMDLIKSQGLLLQSDQFDDGIILHEFGSAQKHFTTLLGSNEKRGDHGIPQTYTLLPLSFLALFGISVSQNLAVGQVSEECVTKYVDLNYSLQLARIRLNDHFKWSNALKEDIPAEYMEDMQETLEESWKASMELTGLFASMLEQVRAGEAKSKVIWDLIEEFENSEHAPKRLNKVTKMYAERLNFTEASKQAEAIWIAYSELAPHFLSVISRSYVFYYHQKFLKNAESWKEDSDLLFKVLRTKKVDIPVFIIDCTGTDKPLSRAIMSQFSGQRVVVENVLEQRKFLSNKCLIRPDPQFLDKSVTTAPSERKPVQIPCPGQECSHHIQSWICAVCFNAVEYASVDDFLYCDCGRIAADKISFNCQRVGHGNGFVSHKEGGLLELLGGLPSAPEVNILILGETGVGKSTFVNAFINYLTFSSLDEALDADHLNWIIPCSFSTQETNERTGQLIQREIKIGTDADEHDGSSGASATQKATTYPLYMDGKLIRLIDTPGIGDTRGPEYDKENMVQILRVLRNYEKLHGIVILLKPNNARLTVMFRFCIKELLTHLHRNAAENMVFGFTNTRGSNYTPGDTFKPLETLLTEYQDVIPGLFKENVYCFDSESFRYLAARKQGIEMGNFEDYRRSWEHSAAESQRLLSYFQSIKTPHEIRSTISLNETKYLIEQLTSPMIRISIAITDTISRNRKEIEDLFTTTLQGDALKAKLQIQRSTMEVRTLAQPKTVCAHLDCIEIRNNTQHGTVTLRKSLCHDPCCLTEVPPNVVGTRLIFSCAAFYNGDCHKCGHPWQDHEHIRVEYIEGSDTTTDPGVQKALALNSDEAQAKACQIAVLQRLMVEYQHEHTLIQEAAAKFSFYLKQHSITGGGNDATLDYLDHLIKDEKAKVGHGGDRTRLVALDKDRTNYINFLKAMEWGKKSNIKYLPLDEAGVRNEAAKLYQLPHYGRDLQMAANAVGRAYSATFREKPYRVRGKSWWQSKKTISWNPFQSLFPTTPTRSLALSRGKRPIRNSPGANESMENSTALVPYSEDSEFIDQFSQDLNIHNPNSSQTNIWALDSIPEHLGMSDDTISLRHGTPDHRHPSYQTDAGPSSHRNTPQHYSRSNQSSESKRKSPGSLFGMDHRTPLRAKMIWFKNLKDTTINKLKKKPSFN